MIIGSNLVFSAWDSDHCWLERMDHSPEEERDCGNKPTEANLTAVRGAPSVHQPLSTNDGGGKEIQYLPINLFQINKLTSKSNVHQLKNEGGYKRPLLWKTDWKCVCLLPLFQSKWGQCSVTLMDMSLALTGLPETHKPVTAASVNHYPATLYLVHICWFTGLWNVFSERHWSNSSPIKLKCRAVSCAEADRPQSNSIIKSDKWQSTNVEQKKLKSCLRMWVWLHSYSDARLIPGLWAH